MKLLERLSRRLRGKAQEGVTELVWVGPGGAVLPTIGDKNHPLAFEINAWVYACVTAIADAVASVPMVVQESKDDAWEDVEEHPLIDLLQYVNADLDSYMLLEQTASWVSLYGNAYWLLLSATKNGPPNALQVLRADKVAVKPGKGERSGTIAGYTFGEGENARSFKDTEVVQFKTFSPTSPYYGQSPIKVIQNEINAYTSSTRYNSAFFKGGGVPSSVLSTEADLDDETINRYRALWDNWTASSKDTRRPLILGRNLKLETPGVAPDVVAVTQLPKMLRETIAAVMRVPPAIVGIYEYANYANVREQRRIFWEGTVVPLARRIAGAATEQLVPLYASPGTNATSSGIRVSPDISGLAALQPDYVELAGAAQQLVDRGILTRDEVRERMFGLEPLGGDWGEGWWGPFATVLLSGSAAGKAQGKGAVVGAGFSPRALDDGDGQAARGLKPATTNARDERKVRLGKSLRRLSDEARGVLYKAFNLRREEETKQIKGIVQDWYDELEDEMFSNLESSKALGRPNRVKDPALDELEFDEEEAGKRLGILLLPVLTDLLLRSGQEAIAEISIDISFDIDNPRAQELLRSRVLEMMSVAERAQGRVRDSLAQGLAEGETIEQLTERVSEWARVGKEAYAETVARTETGIVMNEAAREGYEQGGATGLEWLSVIDERSRDEHADMDGTIVTMDEKFDLDGNLCDGPQDPVLPVEHVANCRCTSAPVVDEG
jgi:HK97 family phage portal protein